jgi:hypothetical protein
VIPILVDNARMPLANQLPPTLAPLDRRNAVEINPIFDIKRLIICGAENFGRGKGSRDSSSFETDRLSLS